MLARDGRDLVFLFLVSTAFNPYIGLICKPRIPGNWWCKRFDIHSRSWPETVLLAGLRCASEAFT